MTFKALLIDAYRQLSAAKLFWITMGLSALVVTVFGSIGFTPEGMSLFFGAYSIENDMINEGSPWARGLYVGIYSNFLCQIWLAWIATILALISTCTIFPEFVKSGSIELTLSKPTSRIKIFLMKYAVSLLFVILQVSIFCVGVFLCVGLRIGEWNWVIFTAIPVVALFYSYLYSLCVLIGMVTKSGISALLITAVFWMVLWSSQTAESVLNRFATAQRVTIESFEESVNKQEIELLALEEKSPDDFRIQKRRERIDSMKEDINNANELFTQIDLWHKPVSWALTALPKTGQTIGLLNRWLSDDSGFDIQAMMRGEMRSLEEIEAFDATTWRARERETKKRIDEDYEGRSLWYVIGTSLLFEFIILSLAAWLFKRKDF
mgnify:CR=1 FL=1